MHTPIQYYITKYVPVSSRVSLDASTRVLNGESLWVIAVPHQSKYFTKWLDGHNLVGSWVTLHYAGL